MFHVVLGTFVIPVSHLISENGILLRDNELKFAKRLLGRPVTKVL